jgi:hypothetical protein
LDLRGSDPLRRRIYVKISQVPIASFGFPVVGSPRISLPPEILSSSTFVGVSSCSNADSSLRMGVAPTKSGARLSVNRFAYSSYSTGRTWTFKCPMLLFLRSWKEFDWRPLTEAGSTRASICLVVGGLSIFQAGNSYVGGGFGIAAIGGVEAVVKAMKTSPKCQASEKRACGTLRNLACCSIGKKKVVETGGTWWGCCR